MAYRKFNADHLFTGNQMLGKDSVLVTDEQGKVDDIIPLSEAGDHMETYPGILSPGFINCHCHLELSHMHGLIPRNTGMTKFLLSVLKGRIGENARITEAMEVSDAYMKEVGIVGVGDICNTDYSLAVKSRSQLHYHNFIEITGFVDEHAHSRFNDALELYSRFTAGQKAASVSIVPHSPYSVSDELFRLINTHRKGSLLTIHNQESIAETEFFTTGKGDLLELYAALDIDVSHFTPTAESSLVRSIIKITGDHSLILVHNVNTTEEDLEALKRGRNLPQLFWCLCPNANLYINGTLPNVELLKKSNCFLIVGTDSLASNSQLSILEELKTLQTHFPSISTAELLKWATSNGAAALRLEQQYGSFQKGKQPGIVNISGGKYDQLGGTIARRVL